MSFDGTSATTGPSTITAESLLASMQRMLDELDRFEHRAPQTIAMYENVLATTTEPRRVHRHRKNQSLAYHTRIQKKWRKRFGTVQKPAAFQIDTSALHPWARGGVVLVCHPVIAAQMRAQGAWMGGTPLERGPGLGRFGA